MMITIIIIIIVNISISLHQTDEKTETMLHIRQAFVVSMTIVTLSTWHYVNLSWQWRPHTRIEWKTQATVNGCIYWECFGKKTRGLMLFLNIKRNKLKGILTKYLLATLGNKLLQGNVNKLSSALPMEWNLF